MGSDAAATVWAAEAGEFTTGGAACAEAMLGGGAGVAGGVGMLLAGLGAIAAPADGVGEEATGDEGTGGAKSVGIVAVAPGIGRGGPMLGPARGGVAAKDVAADGTGGGTLFVATGIGAVGVVGIGAGVDPVGVADGTASGTDAVVGGWGGGAESGVAVTGAAAGGAAMMLACGAAGASLRMMVAMTTCPACGGGRVLKLGGGSDTASPEKLGVAGDRPSAITWICAA